MTVPAAARPRRRAWWCVAAVVVLLAVAVVHLNQGASADLSRAVLLGSRLPRVVAGLVAGLGLGVAGALVQSVTRNPLASSDTLGVNAGAYLGVVAAKLAVPALPVLALLSGGTAAFLGGGAAMVAVWLLTSGGTRTPGRVLLAGAAIGFLASAVAALLLLFNEESAGQLYFWGNGSLIQNSLTRPVAMGVVVVVAAGVALALARPLDLVRMGDDTAAAMGVPVVRVRATALVLAVVCAASAVTVCGPIGFVGLLAPIAVRRLGWQSHRWLIPMSGVTAAILLLAADVAVRIVAPPSAGFGELPVGVLAAMLGGPVFVLLARRVVTGDDGSGATVAVRSRLSRRGFVVVLIGGAVALAAAIGLGLRVGEIDIGWTAWAPWLAEQSTLDVIGLRVPRILVAALAGVFLAVAGTAVQSVVRNPLAEPQLLGATGGAAVGAVAVITLLPTLPAEAIPIAASVGGCLALAAVVALGRGRAAVLDPTRVVLVGIGVAATAGAVVDLLVVRAHLQIASALTWLSGSTYARGTDEVVWLAPGLVIVVLLVLAARPLDLMALGEDLPRSVGMELSRTRVLVLAGAGVLASLTAGAVGAVGFVGLVAPHLARRLVGSDHRRLLVVSALLGATLLVLADAVGRFVLAPKGIPVGVVTAVIGGPYLVWLLRRQR